MWVFKCKFEVEFTKMAKIKVLFVCLGNICRSPLADGILRRKVETLMLNCEVDSAGTAGYHIGSSPDDRMIKTAAKHGTEIHYLKARKFTAADFTNFDHIFVMDLQNEKNVLSLANSEEEKEKVKLILNEINPNNNDEVPDPYYGGQAGFEHVYDLLDSATDKIITKYLQKQ
jgi:protein-tyrosine phosphatase